jgi:anti-sigma regulatory factor (Ser/Thr protein kinase)
MRRAVLELLGRAGLERWQADEVVVALNEAAANAIEHAYGLQDASFAVSVAVEDGEVRLAVRDRGRWRERAGPSDRGRGLAIATGLMDELEVDRGPEGTTLTMTYRPAPPVGQARS